MTWRTGSSLRAARSGRTASEPACQMLTLQSSRFVSTTAGTEEAGHRGTWSWFAGTSGAGLGSGFESAAGSARMSRFHSRRVYPWQ